VVHPHRLIIFASHCYRYCARASGGFTYLLPIYLTYLRLRQAGAVGLVFGSLVPAFSPARPRRYVEKYENLPKIINLEI